MRPGDGVTVSKMRPGDGVTVSKYVLTNFASGYRISSQSNIRGAKWLRGGLFVLDPQT
jgi:hypothetical protein